MDLKERGEEQEDIATGGQRSSPRQQGAVSPHPAGTGELGCQCKPAQLTPVCAASVRTEVEVGPSKLGKQGKAELQPSTPALTQHPDS